jgi:hypothetical protein
VSNTTEGGVRWRAVLLGWVAAFLAGFAITPLLRALYGLLAEPPVWRGQFDLSIVVVSLLAGFLAYLIGGYVAASQARASGGKNGAMTAVLGLVAGLVLAASGVVFSAGVALPPAGFGLTGDAMLAGGLLFLANLFGGYVGGKLGEPSPVAKRHP